ncbi:50S ribosomal protein L21 [Thermocrinis sp.]|uniref:50S ribosomal protein L21 n=1 Tax=Thermocrinis sp. TaxID=2024383 RepID=UPI002FDEAAC1
MYAIIETGGKQYMVFQGTRLKVEKLPIQEGQTIELKPILIGKEGGKIQLQKGRVIAEVVKHGKGKKVIVFKFKSKKNYKRWRGHRQSFTELLIKEIKED